MPQTPTRPLDLVAPFNRAMADLQAGRADAAIAAFDLCIAREPGHAEAHVHRGEALRQKGQLTDALLACDRGLAILPALPSGRLIRGIIRRDLGDGRGAIEDLRAAALFFPKVAAVQALLGFALSDDDQDDAARAVLEAALALDPNVAEVHKVLGDLHHVAGRVELALAAYQRALTLKPDFAEVYANLGRLLFGLRDLPLSIAMSEAAVKLSPGLVRAHCCRAAALRDQGRTEDALAAYREALRHQPDHLEARSEINALRRQRCDWEGLEADVEAVRAQTYRIGTPVTPFAILVGTPAPAEQLACARVWAEGFARKAGAPLAPYEARPADDRSRRLRVGYLSADFHNHATASLIAEMLELHDAARFELFGYSLGVDDDSALRRRLVASFDQFRDLRTTGHRDAAQTIQADGIDILIDLKGYTGEARTEIVACRPAPIQVSFLGYPGTMGADFIDYLIADPIVAPMEHQGFYTEKLVHLPHCYQPNDRKRATARAPSRADCGLPEDGLVFCAINNSYKITAEIFVIWMRLLQAVPGSVLWLLATNEAVITHLSREAEARGIDRKRLVFAPKLAMDAHIARLTLADLFLDTSPVNAHTTASEALWAGVPLVTTVGQSFVGRVAASLLHAIGLPELATPNLAAYEALALRLAQTPDALASIRSRLAANRLTQPLFDTDRYVRSFEAALLHMMTLKDTGRAPEPFAVPA